MSLEKALARAQKQALLYLKTRPRSEHELREKLKEKKHDSAIIDEVITLMFDYGYLNDAEFARAWVNYRINVPLGLRRIQIELKQKGIDQELIDQQVGRITEEYNEEEVVRQAVEKRLKRYVDLEPLKVRKRLYDFLIRKGFSFQVIQKVIKDLVPFREGN